MDDQISEEFEAWLEVNGAWIDSIEHAWTIWQDSRECLVVHLPDEWNAGKEMAYSASEVREALERAGLKVKS